MLEPIVTDESIIREMDVDDILSELEKFKRWHFNLCNGRYNFKKTGKYIFLNTLYKQQTENDLPMAYSDIIQQFDGKFIASTEDDKENFLAEYKKAVSEGGSFDIIEDKAGDAFLYQNDKYLLRNDCGIQDLFLILNTSFEYDYIKD